VIDMLTLLLLIVLVPLVGAITGLLAARWFLFHHHPADTVATTEPADPFVSAEIDQAAAKWATDQGRPEAAGIMADKLHLLYALARQRSQS
jgi:hypothetical protein